MKLRTAVASSMTALLLTGSLAGTSGADSAFDNGPMGFEPLSGSATPTATPNADAPWMVPTGYTQELVSGEDESRCRGLDIYGGTLDDWHDMNTVNETGRQQGRYLYRTHEVRLRSGVIPDATYPDGGAVSVIDLETCEAKILAQDPTWTALDGIVWTPWGTILVAEETTGGRLFEIELDRRDPMKAKAVHDRPAVGRLAHEGIEIGSRGEIYVVDENRGQSGGAGGGVYKFVPERRGDLSSGDLYVLGVDDGDGSGLIGENVGRGEWLGPIDPATARQAGTDAGGASYQRPEDLERIGRYLYVAITEGTRDANGDQNYDGRVIAVNLRNNTVTDYVKPGVNAAVESTGVTGFDNPDNLAKGPDGKLWIVEDNVPSDIWVANGKGATADGIGLFASLTDIGAEGTGIYFGKEDGVLFVNVQHSVYDNGDGTWAIYKSDDADQFDHDDDHHDDDQDKDDRPRRRR